MAFSIFPAVAATAATRFQLTLFFWLFTVFFPQQFAASCFCSWLSSASWANEQTIVRVSQQFENCICQISPAQAEFCFLVFLFSFPFWFFPFCVLSLHTSLFTAFCLSFFRLTPSSWPDFCSQRNELSLLQLLLLSALSSLPCEPPSLLLPPLPPWATRQLASHNHNRHSPARQSVVARQISPGTNTWLEHELIAQQDLEWKNLLLTWSHNAQCDAATNPANAAQSTDPLPLHTIPEPLSRPKLNPSRHLTIAVQQRNKLH